jgi:hypothetical protein
VNKKGVATLGGHSGGDVFVPGVAPAKDASHALGALFSGPVRLRQHIYTDIFDLNDADADKQHLPAPPISQKR